MNKPTRFYSNKQEKAVAKAVGGRQTPNSGATKHVKGDVTTDNILIECKTCTTHKKSFTIQKEWIYKNREEAFAMGKDHSVVVFNFGEGEENHYIISEKLFKKLKEYLDNE